MSKAIDPKLAGASAVLGGVVVGVVDAVSQHPEIAAALPKKWGVIITAVAFLLQAVLPSVRRGSQPTGLSGDSESKAGGKAGTSHAPTPTDGERVQQVLVDDGEWVCSKCSQGDCVCHLSPDNWGAV